MSITNQLGISQLLITQLNQNDLLDNHARKLIFNILMFLAVSPNLHRCYTFSKVLKSQYINQHNFVFFLIHR